VTARKSDALVCVLLFAFIFIVYFTHYFAINI